MGTRSYGRSFFTVLSKAANAEGTISFILLTLPLLVFFFGIVWVELDEKKLFGLQY